MRFKGLDLNLLLAFDTLLTTRSVTRAAERMHLSQAAMSSALGRLRTYFGDEILVASGKRMYPTAFAQSLVPQVRDCLRQLEALIATAPGFDPSTTQRVFRLVASDYITAIVLTPLASRLATTAPGIRLEVLLPSELVLRQIAEGDIDLLITPADHMSLDLPSEELFEERHVVVGCRENPLLRTAISEKQFFAAGHVAVSIGNQHVAAYADKLLENLNKTRRVEVVVPSFTVVPWLLQKTGRLAVMHERLAKVMATRFPIAWVPMPLALPPLREMLQYHFARSKDEGLAWLRREIHAIVAAQAPARVKPRLPRASTRRMHIHKNN